VRALCWHGKNDVRVDTVPDPEIQEPTDAIIKITSTAICGSDLHLYDGFMMGMEKGDVLGHEPMGIKLMGHAPAGLFGYSHVLGGYAGGQADYLRVPHADVGPIKIESDLSDEKVLFLSDIFPTGYMAAENAEIEPGDTVAVWGCGPVAQMAIQSCWMLGASRVIAIDRVPERLKMAGTHGKAEAINFEEEDVYERLNAMTEGRGPDR
jgi:threonine dehydrogenase-like Zn-dependent dehydrogenase